ncbi:MAG: WD40 repeat domain-containing protein [Planctomycetota bacterium]|nr:MAG: WD40 repeat domain-containing protein [Planctomycetota bacterium]REK32857.1 MAG: WD40 repeat domain-containing protein [Planctomycetota bacterium]
MIFDLVKDFADVLDAMPEGHSRRRILKLLDEAIRRDVHFIDRHPTTFFQCLWNTCWWYDCPEAAKHYRSLTGSWRARGPKLYELLETWRAAKFSKSPSQWKEGQCSQTDSTPPPAKSAGLVGRHSYWLRSLRPPAVHLGTAQRAVLRTHEGPVGSVTWSPDSRWILSGSADKTIRVWDADSGAEVAVLRGHEGNVKSVCWSPDGRWIASSSGDITLRLWDAATGAELAVLRGHEERVNSVCWSPDGRRIASGSGDMTVRLWDAATGAALAVLRGHEKEVNSVCWSPDSQRIASGSDDESVRVWDSDNGTELAVLRWSEHSVSSVSWSPDGQRIDAGWGHSSVLSVSWSPDGQRIVCGSRDRTMRLWDADSGAVLAVFRGHDGMVQSVSWSPDARRIVSGSASIHLESFDNSVRVWDAESGDELAVFRGHTAAVLSVSWSPDGRRIVSGGANTDQTVRVWDAEDSAKLRVFPKVLLWIKRCKFWDADRSTELALLRGHEDAVNSIVYSPDGQRIATFSNDMTVRVWDADVGVELAVLRGHEGRVTSVSWSPDGRWIVSGSSDRTVRIWDANSGSVWDVLGGHRFGVTGVSWSPDGRRIASGSGDRTVRIWDAGNLIERDFFRRIMRWLVRNAFREADVGAAIAVLCGHNNNVECVCWSPDSQRIVSGGGYNDNTVRVWNAGSGTEMAVLRGHEGKVNSVSWLPDGQRIVSGSWRDKTVRIWDFESGKCIQVIKGRGDASAIAAGLMEPHPPWRVVVCQGETQVASMIDGRVVSRFPEELWPIADSPSGRAWAGSVASHVHLLQLEGEVHP